eukprot:GHVS01107372.1.p1 GENE.GHVS01107372.1~~GHVS01107372.1.p1  ORF type:complete len:599 (+),score=48.36 GHVS01107372.1:791-2587(+)
MPLKGVDVKQVKKEAVLVREDGRQSKVFNITLQCNYDGGDHARAITTIGAVNAYTMVDKDALRFIQEKNIHFREDVIKNESNEWVLKDEGKLVQVTFGSWADRLFSLTRDELEDVNNLGNILKAKYEQEVAIFEVEPANLQSDQLWAVLYGTREVVGELIMPPVRFYQTDETKLVKVDMLKTFPNVVLKSCKSYPIVLYANEKNVLNFDDLVLQKPLNKQIVVFGDDMETLNKLSTTLDAVSWVASSGSTFLGTFTETVSKSDPEAGLERFQWDILRHNRWSYRNKSEAEKLRDSVKTVQSLFSNGSISLTSDDSVAVVPTIEEDQYNGSLTVSHHPSKNGKIRVRMDAPTTIEQETPRSWPLFEIDSNEFGEPIDDFLKTFMEMLEAQTTTVMLTPSMESEDSKKVLQTQLTFVNNKGSVAVGAHDISASTASFRIPTNMFGKAGDGLSLKRTDNDLATLQFEAGTLSATVNVDGIAALGVQKNMVCVFLNIKNGINGGSTMSLGDVGRSTMTNCGTAPITIKWAVLVDGMLTGFLDDTNAAAIRKCETLDLNGSSVDVGIQGGKSGIIWLEATTPTSLLGSLHNGMKTLYASLFSP